MDILTPMTTQDKLTKTLDERTTILKDSDVVNQIKTAIDKVLLDKSTSFTTIRCLGLGPISDSSNAMYQLSLLNILVKHLFKENENFNISLWDPIFTKEETTYLETIPNFKVEETFETKEIGKTLFYMPHFPIGAFEELINQYKPKYILSNDLMVYYYKQPEAKFFEKSLNCARLAQLILKKSETKSDTTAEQKPVDDGFQLPTKKKNRKKTNSIRHTPIIINYDFESAYFNDVKATNITKGNILDNQWTSSFSDMCFMEIISKN